MIFKILGFITSLGNVAIILALFYNRTIAELGTPHWNMALGSIVFLSVFSTTLFYLSNKKDGRSALKIYGSIYAFCALLIYAYWSFKNLFLDIGFAEFKGFFFLFFILLLISTFSIRSYMKAGDFKLLLLLSNVLSILTVAITFGTIYKYVFLQANFDFQNLLRELFMIFLGSLLFLGTYVFAKKKK